MIEKKIVRDHFLEYQIADYLRERFEDIAIVSISFERSPQGERVVIETPTPGLIIGRGGANINRTSQDIKEKFGLSNPQIRIVDFKRDQISAAVVAKRIINDLKRFGPKRFRSIANRNMDYIMRQGIRGIEIVLAGKLQSPRSKAWRFSKGFIKKTGHVSDFVVDSIQDKVCLNLGIVGIKVTIMKQDIILPDRVDIIEKEDAMAKVYNDAMVEEHITENEE